MEKQSPVQRIWELGKSEHGHLITAVLLAVIGVICGMVPYFAAARIIILLLAGERALSAYTVWLGAALAGYLVRTVLYAVPFAQGDLQYSQNHPADAAGEAAQASPRYGNGYFRR